MTKEETLIRNALLDILYEILLFDRKPNAELNSLNPILADHAHNIPLWLKRDSLNLAEIRNYYESERIYCIDKLIQSGFTDELKKFEPSWETPVPRLMLVLNKQTNNIEDISQYSAR